MTREEAIKILEFKRDSVDIEGYCYTLEHIQLIKSYNMAIEALNQQKEGHWIGIDEEPHEDYECDKCGYVVSTFTANIEPHTEYKYCPNCGARMVETQESDTEQGLSYADQDTLMSAT